MLDFWDFARAFFKESRVGGPFVKRGSPQRNEVGMPSGHIPPPPGEFLKSVVKKRHSCTLSL